MLVSILKLSLSAIAELMPKINLSKKGLSIPGSKKPIVDLVFEYDKILPAELGR